MRPFVPSALLLVTLVAPVAGQDPLPFFARHEIVDAAAAPEGSLVAYTLRFADPVVDSFRYSVAVIPAKGGAPWTLGAGRQPAFAPKGQAIAWLARHGEAWQLLVRDSLGGADRQLTDLPTGVAAFRWSPDGSTIALAADASAPFPGGRRFDGGDRNARRALYLVPAEGGDLRRLTGDDFAVGPAEPGLERLVEFDWLDDSSLVVSGRIIGGEEPREGASLFVVNAGDGSRRYLAGTGGRWHLPVVSPDRQWVAFTGQPVGTPTWAASELIVLHPDGTGLKRLTVGLDRDVLDLAWHGNRDLWFATEDRGSRNVQKVDVRSGKLSPGTSGLHLLSLQSIPNRGDWALALRSTPDLPGELVKIDLGRPSQFTTLVSPDSAPASGELEEFEFRASDGTAIGAWLRRPPDFDPARRYPLLVDVHGGPHAMTGYGYSPSALAAAAAGWLVLRVNPHGSTGYGFDMVNGLGRQWPGQDVADLRAAIADVLSRGLVDSSRIAVVGTGAGAVTAAALRVAEPLIRATVLRCPGDGWLPGSSGTDAAPWHEWHAARPFRTLLPGWLDTAPIRSAIASRTPVLVSEGVHLAPTIFDFGAFYHAELGRAGIPTTFIRLDGSCGEVGPATQGALFATEQRWLTRYVTP